jgi:hypothetical protein
MSPRWGPAFCRPSTPDIEVGTTSFKSGRPSALNCCRFDESRTLAALCSKRYLVSSRKIYKCVGYVYVLAGNKTTATATYAEGGAVGEQDHLTRVGEITQAMAARAQLKVTSSLCVPFDGQP